MKRHLVLIIGVAWVLALVGCAQKPKIDASKVTAPKTVVINDFPDMVSGATIGLVVTSWPGAYFSPHLSGTFAISGSATGQPGVPSTLIGDTGGLVGALIQSNADETQMKALEFPSLVRKSLRTDLRSEVLASFRDSLQAKGIQVRIASETRNAPMRLHWPAKTEKGEPLLTGTFADSPPVDADLLVQLAPVAFYASPGPLNSYERRVGIGLAMYNGRTRQFIGWQAFEFKPSDRAFTYLTYDSMVSEVDKAAQALRSALLSLVPQVVRTISGESQ